jgi:hypothetical protein
VGPARRPRRLPAARTTFTPVTPCAVTLCARATSQGVYWRLPA